VRVAVLLTAPTVAVIVTVVVPDTEAVDTVKVPELLPAGIVSEAGTVAAALLLASLTDMPPEGAGPVSVAVPVELAKLFTVVGFRVSADRLTVAAGFTDRVAVLVAPP
jgi:hypothetical protein